ncbi:MAG TPA: mercuric transporter MerT family protein [Terracidiphilus sp.]|jgi:hypothetical protein
MKSTAITIGSSFGAIGSSLLAAITSLCCIGPAVFAILGTGGVLAAARLAPWRPLFILGSVVLLELGFWLAYRPGGGCIGKTCATTGAKVTRAVLWLAAALAVAAILLPNFVRG